MTQRYGSILGNDKIRRIGEFSGTTRLVVGEVNSPGGDGSNRTFRSSSRLPSPP